MKIVHIESGRHLYGGAIQVVLLLKGLHEHAVHNVLVCPTGSDIANAAAGCANQVMAVPMRGDLDATFVVRLARILRRERADLLHVHSRRGADVLGGIAARLAGVPALISRRVDNPEKRWQVALKYRLYDHVIAISQGIRRVLIAEGLAPEKVTCVPSAVDTERYRPGGDRKWFQREFGLAADERAVGMVAQFIARKGHRLLVAAAPRIIENHPRTRFVLLGRGPEEPAIRATVASAGLNDQFVFAGFRDDLPRLLPCLDVLVHPAYREGLGVSLLQAAACGVPVVASSVGGIPEIVPDERVGLLVQPGVVAELEQAVVKALGWRATVNDHGFGGRQFVEANFSVSAMVAGNLACYRALSGLGAVP